MDLEVADFHRVSCKVNVLFELNVVHKVKKGECKFKCLSHWMLLSAQTSIILFSKVAKTADGNCTKNVDKEQRDFHSVK